MAELFSIERIMNFCEMICYFVLVNFMFVISNLPVLVFLLFVGISQIRTCLPLFLLSMVFTAPSLSAVFYAMNRLVQGIERNAVKDYIKGYTSDFWQKICLGLGHMTVVFVLWTNTEFFAVQINHLPLTIVSFVLFAVSVLIAPNLYMLAARYEMKNLQIVRTAVTLLIARPAATLGNVTAFAILLAAFELSAGTTVLFAGSVYGFLIMFMNQKVMRELESQ